MKSFPEQLLAARKASGLTQEQLAEQLNVSRPMISHWETGRSLPDLETARHLSQILEYNFLQESEQEFTAQPEASDTLQDTSTSPRRSHSAFFGFLVGAAVTMVVALFIILLVRPQSIPAQGTAQHVYKPFVEGDGTPEWFREPNKRLEGQAYLTMTSPEDPLKAIVSEDGEVIWRYEILLDELNGVNFTIEKYVIAMFYSKTMVLIDSFDAQTIQTWWGFNTITSGGSFSIWGDIPRRNMLGVGFMFIGVDENGNEKVFHHYLQLLQEISQTGDARQAEAIPAASPTIEELVDMYSQPNERIDDQAYVEISTEENPLRAVRSDVFASGAGWRYSFILQELNVIDFTAEQAMLTIFFSDTRETTYTYGVTDIRQWWGNNLIIGDGKKKYYLDGDMELQDAQSIGIQLSGTDANGNPRTFQYLLALSKEIADNP